MTQLLSLGVILLGIRRHRRQSGDATASAREICTQLRHTSLADVQRSCRHYARAGKLEAVSNVQQPFKPYIPVGYRRAGVL